MKQIFTILLLLFYAFLFASCTKTITSEQLQERNGLKYEVNSQTPFTGKVIDYYENKTKKSEDLYKEGHFVEGKSWNEKSQLLTETHSSNDQIETKKVWWDNGQLKRDLHFAKGNIDAKIWGVNGTLICSFKNDAVKPIIPIDIHEQDGKIKETIYCLNKGIVPIDIGIKCIGLSLEEVRSELGTPSLMDEERIIYNFYDQLGLSMTLPEKFAPNAGLQIYFSRNVNGSWICNKFYFVYLQIPDKSEEIISEMNNAMTKIGFDFSDKGLKYVNNSTNIGGNIDIFDNGRSIYYFFHKK
jgi:hypothetical protein